jgi:hypothetical protein
LTDPAQRAFAHPILVPSGPEKLSRSFLALGERPVQMTFGRSETMAITTSSLAYGNCDSSAPGTPSTDQRGLPRTISGRLDLGAYELQ